ncbi:type II secretion system protein M [Paraburkholderia jirisanensis]
MDTQIRELRVALTEWFGARAPREKALLVAGGALLMAVLVYTILWQPASDGAASIDASLPLLEGQLADMQMQADRARQLKGAAALSTPSGPALRDALSNSLVEAGIANPQLTVLGKSVQVDAKAVSFNTWMTWLDDVRRTRHVRVVGTHVTAQEQPGRVSVSVTLEPASGS